MYMYTCHTCKAQPTYLLYYYLPPVLCLITIFLCIICFFAVEMAFQNVSDEMASKFPGHHKKTNTESMTLNMQVYSVNETAFDPLDHSIDNEKARKSKKRIYKLSRPVQKSIVFLNQSCLQPNHTILYPSGMALRKLNPNQNIPKFSCSRTWDNEETRQKLLQVSPFPDFIYLRPAASLCMTVSDECSMDVLLKRFAGGHNIYLLEVQQLLIIMWAYLSA